MAATPTTVTRSIAEIAERSLRLKAAMEDAATTSRLIARVDSRNGRDDEARVTVVEGP
jgi:hypothetical protein